MRYKLMMRPDVAQTRQKLEKAPDDPDLWYELGMALSNAGDNEAAVDAFSKGISLAPFILTCILPVDASKMPPAASGPPFPT